MSTSHVLVMPCPAQGHVLPALEFSQCLAKHGVRVTFVNTEYNHKKVLKSLEGKNDIIDEKINMVSIPDGVEPWEDRGDMWKATERMLQVMPGKLEELIEELNTREGEEIDCVIADGTAPWALEIAVKMNIKCATIWTASAAVFAFTLSLEKLIDDGIDNNIGTLSKEQRNTLVPNVPPLNNANYFRTCIEHLTSNKVYLQGHVDMINAIKVVDYVICNSTYDLEPVPFSMVPKLLPVGPLLASNRLGNSAGHFWQEDSTCLKWLDLQQPNSVVYVAFGSFAVFDKTQFEELALGLELCNRPFLWVVRPDITIDANDAYPEGFTERIAARGRIVSWAPQQKALSHPSIGCFLSHCGWNSTMEGLCNGVPFLCWPYFHDQFMDEDYICDVWKIGLKFNKNESGIITREEIKNKVDQVCGDEQFKARAVELGERALSSVREGGSSNTAIQNFIQWTKAAK